MAQRRKVKMNCDTGSEQGTPQKTISVAVQVENVSCNHSCDADESQFIYPHVHHP